MKTNLFLTLSLLLSTSYSYTAPMKLESGIVATVDGLSIGIDGEVIALIKQYQGQIMRLLVGRATRDGRVGQYEFEGKPCTVQQLSTLEQIRGTSPLFLKLRKKIGDDFEVFSIPFKKNVHSSKAVMALLVEESCTKRNRLNSVLYIWSKTDEKNEYELFHHHVKSIKDIEIFMTDLHNFLSDLVFSCPKAQIQYAGIVEKFRRVKQFTTQINIPIDRQPAFLKHVNKLLAKMNTEEITKQKVTELYRNFNS